MKEAAGRNTSTGAVTHGGMAQRGDEPDATQEECGDTILHGHGGEAPLCLIPASSPAVAASADERCSRNPSTSPAGTKSGGAAGT